MLLIPLGNIRVKTLWIKSIKSHQGFFVLAGNVPTYLVDVLTIFPLTGWMLRGFRWVHIFSEIAGTCRKIT